MEAGQTQRPMEPIELPGRNSSTYGDGDIPEIDLPGADNATPSIPEECPQRGMQSCCVRAGDNLPCP